MKLYIEITRNRKGCTYTSCYIRIVELNASVAPLYGAVLYELQGAASGLNEHDHRIAYSMLDSLFVSCILPLTFCLVKSM